MHKQRHISAICFFIFYLVNQKAQQMVIGLEYENGKRGCSFYPVP